jgi:hypothetical protein
MDVNPVITEIELALSKAALLAEQVKEQRGAALAGTIREITEALIEAKRQALALQEDLSGIEELLAAHDQIAVEHGVLWRFIGDKKIGGPFCPKCHATAHELVKLHYHPGAIGRHPQSPYYTCERCGARIES